MKRCALGVLLCLAGCSHPFQSLMYQTPVHQGAYLEPSTLDSIKKPISKNEIVALLGTPTLSDPFHPDRVDYWHSTGTQDALKTSQHLVLLFDQQEQLKRVHTPT